MAFNLTRRRFLQSASLAAVSIPLSKVVSAETGFTPSPLKPKAPLRKKLYPVAYVKCASGAVSSSAKNVKADL